MKRVVIKKNSNNGKRDKAFLGAIIGAAAGIIGGAISAKKKRKAEELAFNQQQAEQSRVEGVQQAQAMTSTYANQGYVDQYLDKVTLKNGGKVKVKQGKQGDRIAHANKYKAGGRSKKLFGSLIGKDGVGGEVEGAAGGVAGLVSSIFSKPTAPKMIKKADGFTFNGPKEELAANSYQLDAEGNPITSPLSITNPIDPNLVTNPAYNSNQSGMAKMGKRKVVKSK